MATCDNLNDQIKRLEDEQKADEALIRAAKAAHATADPVASKRTRILRTYTGEAVEFNPDVWARQAELDAMRIGSEAVQEMVKAALIDGKTPNGRTGRMVNYTKIAPNDENIAALLEVMGFQRAGTEAGIELKRPFTQNAAANALMAAAKQVGSDPLAMANFLKKRVAGIDNLPSTVFILSKSKWDAASQYAQVLDDLADAIDGSYLTPAMSVEAGNVARWAHYFEQMDAVVRRKVGQALRTMQFGQDPSINLLNLQKEAEMLTLADVKGDSMIADMIQLMKEGKSDQLRRMAAAKRADMAIGINQPGWRRDLALLNSLRRANLLSGVATWLVRNPVGGALVQGVYMGEDIMGGTMRLVHKNGLPTGVADGLQAAAFAGRGWLSGFSMAWGNMKTSFLDGTSTFGDDALKYVESAGELQDSKSIVMEASAFNQAWDDLTTWKGMTNPFAPLKLLNGSFWHVFGGGVEKLTGSEWGYMAPFRVLNATDEFMKTQAYVWKTHHEAFMMASEQGRKLGKPVEWIEARASELAENTIFSGVFTDDQLVEFRKARNKEYGMPLGDEIDNDELRLMLYNQMHGVPNTQTELGQVGLKRAEDVTFTGDFKGMMAPVLNGVSQMRQNPFFGWAVPFWRVPVNGIGWALNRDMFLGTARWALQEVQQVASRAEGQARYTDMEMFDARARAVVAVTMGVVTHSLWENGLFTDGGSFDPRQRERERRGWVPYAFSLPATMGIAAWGKIRANGIELIDLMGLQADVARAVHDGILSANEAAEWNKPIVAAYASLLKNKAALKGITALLNYAQDPQRYDFNRVMGDQLGGIMPISGFGGNLTRGFSDPETQFATRRTLSANEMAALSTDPIWTRIKPVVDALQGLGDAVVRGNAPWAGNMGLLPREKDWLGNRIERPLGLPLDLAIPFMPVIKPQDPVFTWLAKHGFGDKPHPKGQLGVGDVELQMTNDEENFYRETMRTARGGTDPAALGVSPGRLLPIASIVNGRTLYEALNELRNNPMYNQMLDSPDGGISPSLKVHPGQSLTKRKAAGGKELYYPIDDIIEYYDKLAQNALIANDKLQFKDRYVAVVKRQQGKLQQYLEGLTPLGVGRQ